VVTGPAEETDASAAGRDRMRASHADREQVIEVVKYAFVQGRLDKDEFDAQVGQAFASRTYAELAAVTAGIPTGPAAAGPARPSASARRWPLAKAAAKSGGCLVIGAAAVRVGTIADPDPGATPGPIPKFLVPLCLLIVLAAVVGALFILGHGVSASIEQRRSRRQPPPRPGPDGHALEAEIVRRHRP